ncbi:hypothetical protein PMIN04_006745 [Paraphaeosphaeria minitans]
MPRRLPVLDLVRSLSIVDVPPSSGFPRLGRAAFFAHSSFAHPHPLTLCRNVSSSSFPLRLGSRAFPSSFRRLPTPPSRAMTTSSASAAPHTNGTTEGQPSTANESTQTRSFPEPKVAKMSKEGVDEDRWSVESVLKNEKLSYLENTDSPIPFFHLLERLKTTHRAGWRRFGIDDCESISDHMYRMSLITMMAPASLTSKLDMAKCTRMALIHDMAEALVGDITPVDNVSKPEKSRREAETMDYICHKLLGKFSGGLNGQQVRAIWQEYEDSETLESKFVHDVDKVELISQMIEYERKHQGSIDLGEFTWVTKKILSAEVKGWSDELLLERLDMWKGFGKDPNWADGTKPESKPTVS